MIATLEALLHDGIDSLEHLKARDLISDKQREGCVLIEDYLQQIEDLDADLNAQSQTAPFTRKIATEFDSFATSVLSDIAEKADLVLGDFHSEVKSVILNHLPLPEIRFWRVKGVHDVAD